MIFWAWIAVTGLAPLAWAQQDAKGTLEDPMSGSTIDVPTNQSVQKETPKTTTPKPTLTQDQTRDLKKSTDFQDPMENESVTPTHSSIEEKPKTSTEGVPASNPQDPMSGSTSTPGTTTGTPKTKPTAKPRLTPDIANLNLPTDLTVDDPDPDKVIFLPAGTYRQILQFPIDSPLMRKAQTTREHHGPEVKAEETIKTPATHSSSPLWIRYEGLEKIKIGSDERRGGIDLPMNGAADLKPRIWYAKSEDADPWSSLFYFVFGGAGYTVANLAGWSAGNTRELPNSFEYRLIRK